MVACDVHVAHPTASADWIRAIMSRTNNRFSHQSKCGICQTMWLCTNNNNNEGWYFISLHYLHLCLTLNINDNFGVLWKKKDTREAEILLISFQCTNCTFINCDPLRTVFIQYMIWMLYQIIHDKCVPGIQKMARLMCVCWSTVVSLLNAKVFDHSVGLTFALSVLDGLSLVSLVLSPNESNLEFDFIFVVKVGFKGDHCDALCFGLFF